MRLLVVDDNATNRLVAAQMLKEFDVRIHMACDGAEAVAAASRDSYDVILMDMRMPDMDGLQATRAIRARGGRFADLPIIAFTATALRDDIDACREAGMNGFVAKPVRKAELVAALARVLSGPSAAGSPTAEVPQQQGGTDDASPDIFKRETYDKLAGEIGEDSAREMLELFLAETDRRIALLRRLSCELDRSAIVRAAHALKGDAGAFGLVQLTALARALERDAKRMTDGEYRTALDHIEPAFAIARDRLPKQAAPAA